MACGLNTVAACITRHRQFTGVQCPCMFVAIVLLFPSRWVCTGTFSYSDRSGLIHPYNQLLPVLHCGSVHLLSTLLFVADQRAPFKFAQFFILNTSHFTKRRCFLSHNKMDLDNDHPRPKDEKLHSYQTSRHSQSIPRFACFSLSPCSYWPADRAQVS